MQLDSSLVAVTAGAGLAWALARVRAFATAPVARRVPHKVLYGDTGKVGANGKPARGEGPLMDPPLERNDDLFWLRSDDRSDEEVIELVKQENDYSMRQMQHTAKLQDQLYREMLSRIQETQSGVPVLENGYYYYRRTEKGLSYPIHCRKTSSGREKESPRSPDAIEAAEEVVLDENELARDKAYCDVGGMEVSPSTRLLAYAVDYAGDETYDIRFRDLETGKELPDVVKGTTGAVDWGFTDRVVFYTTQDEAKRSYRVYKHVLGQSSEEDELLFEELDTLFSVGVCTTRCRRFLLVESGSSETSEALFADLAAPAAEEGACKDLASCLRMVEPRSHGLRYDVNVWRDRLIVVHNDGGAKKNGELAFAPLGAPGKDNWSSLVPYEPEVQVVGSSAFDGHLAVTGREGGSRRVWLLSADVFDTLVAPSPSPASGKQYAELVAVPTDEEVCRIGLSSNPERSATRLRYSYSSPVTPWQTLELDVPALFSMVSPGTSNRRSVIEPTSEAIAPIRTLLKQQPTPNVDPSQYACRRVYCSVPRDSDNPKSGKVDVPISLVWRPDRFEGGEPRLAPTLLYGYGSYGISMDPTFNTWTLSLLDRGALYAVAHVRGGGEMGRPWYEDMGKFHAKKNTFSDFVACAEHLSTEGWTDAKRVACLGRSAGGLLVGRALTMRPDMWACVVADVPFVDVLTTMCDETIPLTTGEWEEWGNVNEREAFETVKEYSPVDTIPSGAKLPPVLLTAGLHDPRVQYWEPLKFAQRLRAAAGPESGPILMKIDMSSGHFSASDRYKFIREQAFETAFLLKQLALE